MRALLFVGMTLLFGLGRAARAEVASSQASVSQQADAPRIAEAYGFSHLREIDRIRYTIDAGFYGIHLRRSWVWEPRTDTVTCEWSTLGIKSHHTYCRRTLNEGRARLNAKVDKWFVNDQFWLMFPYHLVWDATSLSPHGKQLLPIPPGIADELTVQYTKAGGYTPGDAYDVFYGPMENVTRVLRKREDFLLRQWKYRRGGRPQPLITCTWEGNHRVGPLVLSLEHKNASGHFHLIFTDVAVQLRGQQNWVLAQPL